MNKLILMTALSTLAVSTAYATTEEFSEADQNEDGVLSTEEAETALPDVLIVDNNNDGMLNQAEAEIAVPGLMFSSDDEDKNESLIGPAEYEQIVQRISEMENSRQKS